MVPRWAYLLMVENRSKCCMERDEHGRPIAERLPERKTGKEITSPGYGDCKYNLYGGKMGGKSSSVPQECFEESGQYEEFGR